MLFSGDSSFFPSLHCCEAHNLDANLSPKIAYQGPYQLLGSSYSGLILQSFSTIPSYILSLFFLTFSAYLHLFFVMYQSLLIFLPFPFIVSDLILQPTSFIASIFLFYLRLSFIINGRKNEGKSDEGKLVRQQNS